MKLLPGFRDFYPEGCAMRNYILTRWREVARRYGFVEYDGPVLESTDLYRKKSGQEIVGQLFNFTDKGEREVAMRPEMTPTLARMVIAKERDYKKPMKWFSAPQFFRYEKQQRGRLREFYQLNCDIIGESAVAADAELVALAIDTLRSFGFTSDDFVVRLSDRNAWYAFMDAKGIDRARGGEFLQIIDKLEREEKTVAETKLGAFGVTYDEVKEFVADPGKHFSAFNDLARDLEARGMKDYLQLDPTIVRGLAYYTGSVFEVFDRKKTLRALAGGGRYDNLMRDLSDGSVNLPALGFGMGDVVLGELIKETPKALELMNAWIKGQTAVDLYGIIAQEERRPEALKILQSLRDEGFSVDYPLTASKVGKQFQAAEQLGATVAILFGEEWPQVKIKTLASRQETMVSLENLLPALRDIFRNRD